MKRIQSVIGIICALLLMQCSLQRTMHTDIRNILTYTPQGVSTLSEEQIKSTYLRGYHLYKATCSSCHGLSSTGKDTIPAFTFNQLDNYKTSATRGDPDNHAVTKKLSPEQLSDILTFLYFKTLARHAENMKKQD